MTTNKNDLIRDLRAAHEGLRAALDDLPPERVVYPLAGWTVQDIVGHLAVWYGERIKGVSALRRGEAYRIPNFDMDAFNQRTVEEHRGQTFAAVRAEWEQAYAELIALLDLVPDGDYEAEMTLPWGAQGTLGLFIVRLVEHIQEHHADMLNVAR